MILILSINHDLYPSVLSRETGVCGFLLSSHFPDRKTLKWKCSHSLTRIKWWCMNQSVTNPNIKKKLMNEWGIHLAVVRREDARRILLLLLLLPDVRHSGDMVLALYAGLDQRYDKLGTALFLAAAPTAWPIRCQSRNWYFTHWPKRVFEQVTPSHWLCLR